MRWIPSSWPWGGHRSTSMIYRKGISKRLVRIQMSSLCRRFPEFVDLVILIFWTRAQVCNERAIVLRHIQVRYQAQYCLVCQNQFFGGLFKSVLYTWRWQFGRQQYPWNIIKPIPFMVLVGCNGCKSVPNKDSALPILACMSELDFWCSSKSLLILGDDDDSSADNNILEIS